MQYDLLIQCLADNAARIRQLAEGVSLDQARWKPNPSSWSILEVINHLLDEEKYDFRVRLDIILHSPEKPWPDINTQAWVSERGYNQRDLIESIHNFSTERNNSLAWLKSLVSPHWEAACTTTFGTILAGDMFTAWVGHDLLHMRQMVELHHAYLLNLAAPFSLAYAGKW
jgi:hypothetical protein